MTGSERGGGRAMGIAVTMVMALVIAGFTWFSAEEQSVPITGREQRVALSDEQQQQLGLEVFNQTLEQQQSALITSGPEFEMVQRVATRIAKQGAADKPEFEWEVALVDSPEVNAFCLPGGKIVIYTGILDVAKSEAGLATVMGHEVAHAVAEHGAERVLREKVSSTAIGVAAGGIAQDPQQFQQISALLGGGAQYGLQMPWGRAQESESDHIGLIYMARAGYDPRESVPFWSRMQKASKRSAPPEYLSTHPSEQRRIRQLKGWMPDALAEYRKS